MRKGDKELSVIITFIILLVVAVVVISMFLKIVKPIEVEGVEYLKIKNECNKLCSKVKNAHSYAFLGTAWEYCTRTFHLLQGDYIEIIGQGTGKFAFCRDAMHCFNIVEEPCRVSGEIITPEKCLEYMCKKALEIYEGNVTLASQRVQEDMNPGTCDLRQGAVITVEGGKRKTILEKTWYELYFKNVNCSKFEAPPPTAQCGNGICELGEDESTCPQDCKSQQPPTPPTPPNPSQPPPPPPSPGS